MAVPLVWALRALGGDAPESRVRLNVPDTIFFDSGSHGATATATHWVSTSSNGLLQRKKIAAGSLSKLRPRLLRSAEDSQARTVAVVFRPDGAVAPLELRGLVQFLSALERGAARDAVALQVRAQIGKPAGRFIHEAVRRVHADGTPSFATNIQMPRPALGALAPSYDALRGELDQAALRLITAVEQSQGVAIQRLVSEWDASAVGQLWLVNIPSLELESEDERHASGAYRPRAVDSSLTPRGDVLEDGVMLLDPDASDRFRGTPPRGGGGSAGGGGGIDDDARVRGLDSREARARSLLSSSDSMRTMLLPPDMHSDADAVSAPWEAATAFGSIASRGSTRGGSRPGTQGHPRSISPMTHSPSTRPGTSARVGSGAPDELAELAAQAREADARRVRELESLREQYTAALEEVRRKHRAELQMMRSAFEEMEGGVSAVKAELAECRGALKDARNVEAVFQRRAQRAEEEAARLQTALGRVASAAKGPGLADAVREETESVRVHHLQVQVANLEDLLLAETSRRKAAETLRLEERDLHAADVQKWRRRFLALEDAVEGRSKLSEPGVHTSPLRAGGATDASAAATPGRLARSAESASLPALMDATPSVAPFRLGSAEEAKLLATGEAADGAAAAPTSTPRKRPTSARGSSEEMTASPMTAAATAATASSGAGTIVPADATLGLYLALAESEVEATQLRAEARRLRDAIAEEEAAHAACRRRERALQLELSDRSRAVGLDSRGVAGSSSDSDSIVVPSLVLPLLPMTPMELPSSFDFASPPSSTASAQTTGAGRFSVPPAGLALMADGHGAGGPAASTRSTHTGTSALSTSGTTGGGDSGASSGAVAALERELRVLREKLRLSAEEAAAAHDRTRQLEGLAKENAASWEEERKRLLATQNQMLEALRVADARRLQDGIDGAVRETGMRWETQWTEASEQLTSLVVEMTSVLEAARSEFRAASTELNDRLDALVSDWEARDAPSSRHVDERTGRGGPSARDRDSGAGGSRTDADLRRGDLETKSSEESDELARTRLRARAVVRFAADALAQVGALVESAVADRVTVATRAAVIQERTASEVAKVRLWVEDEAARLRRRADAELSQRVADLEHSAQAREALWKEELRRAHERSANAERDADEAALLRRRVVDLESAVEGLQRRLMAEADVARLATANEVSTALRRAEEEAEAQLSAALAEERATLEVDADAAAKAVRALTGASGGVSDPPLSEEAVQALVGAARAELQRTHAARVATLEARWREERARRRQERSQFEADLLGALVERRVAAVDAHAALVREVQSARREEASRAAQRTDRALRRMEHENEARLAAVQREADVRVSALERRLRAHAREAAETRVARAEGQIRETYRLLTVADRARLEALVAQLEEGIAVEETEEAEEDGSSASGPPRAAASLITQVRISPAARAQRQGALHALTTELLARLERVWEPARADEPPSARGPGTAAASLAASVEALQATVQAQADEIEAMHRRREEDRTALGAEVQRLLTESRAAVDEERAEWERRLEAAREESTRVEAELAALKRAHEEAERAHEEAVGQLVEMTRARDAEAKRVEATRLEGQESLAQARTNFERELAAAEARWAAEAVQVEAARRAVAHGAAEMAATQERFEDAVRSLRQERAEAEAALRDELRRAQEAREDAERAVRLAREDGERAVERAVHTTRLTIEADADRARRALEEALRTEMAHAVTAAERAAEGRMEQERRELLRRQEAATEELLRNTERLTGAVRAAAERDKADALAALRRSHEAALAALRQEAAKVAEEAALARAKLLERSQRETSRLAEELARAKEAENRAQERLWQVEEASRAALEDARATAEREKADAVAAAERALRPRLEAAMSEAERGAELLQGLVEDNEELTRSTEQLRSALAEAERALERARAEAETALARVRAEADAERERQTRELQRSVEVEREAGRAELLRARAQWMAEGSEKERAFAREKEAWLRAAEEDGRASSTQLVELERRLAQEEARRAQQRDAEFEARVKRLASEHEAELVEVRRRLDDTKREELAALSRRHAEEMAVAVRRAREESDVAHRHRVMELESAVQRELSRAAAEASQAQHTALEALERRHRAELERLSAEFDQSRATLEAENLAALTLVRQETEALVSRLEDAHAADLAREAEVRRREAQQAEERLAARIEETRGVWEAQAASATQDALSLRTALEAARATAGDLRTKADRAGMVAEDYAARLRQLDPETIRRQAHQSAALEIAQATVQLEEERGRLAAEYAAQMELLQRRAFQQTDLLAGMRGEWMAERDSLVRQAEEGRAEAAAAREALAQATAAAQEAAVAHERALLTLQASSSAQATEQVARERETLTREFHAHMASALRDAATEAERVMNDALATARTEWTREKEAELSHLRRELEEQVSALETNARRLQHAALEAVETRHRAALDALMQRTTAERDELMRKLLDEKSIAVQSAERAAREHAEKAARDAEHREADLKAAHMRDVQRLEHKLEDERAAWEEALREQVAAVEQQVRAELDSLWRERCDALVAAKDAQLRDAIATVQADAHQLAVAHLQVIESHTMAVEDARARLLAHHERALADALAHAEGERQAAVEGVTALWTSTLAEREAQLRSEHHAALEQLRVNFATAQEEANRVSEERRRAAVAAVLEEAAAEREDQAARVSEAIEQSLAEVRAEARQALESLAAQSELERQSAIEEALARSQEERRRALEAARRQAAEDQAAAIEQLRAESERLLSNLEGAMARLREERDMFEDELSEAKAEIRRIHDGIVQRDQWILGARKAGLAQRIQSSFMLVRCFHALQRQKRMLEEKAAGAKRVEQQQWAKKMLAQQEKTDREHMRFVVLADMRKELLETLTSHKREVLMDHKLASAKLQQELAVMTENQQRLQREHTRMTQTMGELEGSVRLLEREVQEIAKQPVIVDGKVNVAVTRKKKRLDHEMDELLLKVSDHRNLLNDLEKEVATNEDRRIEKEEELKYVEGQLVATLIEQQRKLMAVLQSVKVDSTDDADDGGEATNSVSTLPGLDASARGGLAELGASGVVIVSGGGGDGGGGGGGGGGSGGGGGGGRSEMVLSPIDVTGALESSRSVRFGSDGDTPHDLLGGGSHEDGDEDESDARPRRGARPPSARGEANRTQRGSVTGGMFWGGK